MASTLTLGNEAPDDVTAAAPPDAAVGVAEHAAARQLLLFAAGGRVLGCDIASVREIVPFRRCTRLPGSPAYVCGLTNLRGTVVTVVDLAARLGEVAGGAGDAGDATSRRTAPVAAREGGSIVLAEYGAKVVGLAVDGVSDVQTVLESDVEATDAGGGGGRGSAVGAPGVVSGLARLGDEVVVVLDVQTILRQVLA